MFLRRLPWLWVLILDQQVKRLTEELVQQASDLASSDADGKKVDTVHDDEADGIRSPVPSDLRKRKMMEVRKMLEKE